MRQNFKEKRGTENKPRFHSKKTCYGATEYKSDLEAYAARALTDNRIPFGYECATFTVMPSFACTCPTYAQLRKPTNGRPAKFDLQRSKVEPITYTPDFVNIDDETKTGWVMETKGLPNESFPLRFKLFKKFLTDNGYRLTLFIPRTKGQIVQCVEIIKELNKNQQKP